MTETSAPPTPPPVRASDPEPRDVPVRHYDAATAKRGLHWFLTKCFDYPALAIAHRELVSNFFWRDLYGRFRGSMLGAGWTLVQPIFLFCVYFTVFGIVFGAGEFRGMDGQTNFAIYLFTGIIAFSSLMEATNQGLNSVRANGNLVKKVAFPSELLPLSPTLVGSVIHTVGLAVAIPLAFAFGSASLGPEILLLPVVMAIQFVLVLGIGTLLAACNVFVRDTAHLYSVFGTAWFFLSPLFYTPSLINERIGPWAVDVLAIANPAYGLLILYRQVLGIDVPDAPPMARNFVLATTWAVFFFIFGLAVFRSRKSRFADLI